MNSCLCSNVFIFLIASLNSMIVIAVHLKFVRLIGNGDKNASWNPSPEWHRETAGGNEKQRITQTQEKKPQIAQLDY